MRRYGPIFALLIVTTTGCANYPQPYEAATPGNQTGYASAQTAPHRFIVSFTGNANASDAELQTLALRRAAELTIISGGEWFRVLETQPVVETYESKPSVFAIRELNTDFLGTRIGTVRPGVTPAVTPGTDITKKRSSDTASQDRLRVSNREYVIEIELAFGPLLRDSESEIYNAFTLIDIVAAN